MTHHCVYTNYCQLSQGKLSVKQPINFRRYSKYTYHCTEKRPLDLVLTCLKRFEAAKNVDKTCIVRVKNG